MFSERVTTSWSSEVTRSFFKVCFIKKTPNRYTKTDQKFTYKVIRLLL